MAIEDIEIQNPETLTQEMGEAVFSEMFGSEEPQGQVPVEQKQGADAQAFQEVDEDIPNASIRLEKMKKQRDEARQEMQAFKEQLAELKGQVSAFKEFNNGTEKEPEVDPTEYMDEYQKLNYEENQKLKDQVSQLSEIIQGFQTDKAKDKIQKQEDTFFQNNPELQSKKDEVVGDLLDYLKDKPAIKGMIKDGQVTLGEVYGMYQASKPKSTKQAEVSNPDKVFSGHARSVPVNRDSVSDVDSNYKKAVSILSDRDSMNKKQAVEYLQDRITDDLLSQLEI